VAIPLLLAGHAPAASLLHGDLRSIPDSRFRRGRSAQSAPPFEFDQRIAWQPGPSTLDPPR